MEFKEFLTKKGISEAAQKELSPEDIAKYHSEFISESINVAKDELSIKIEAIKTENEGSINKETAQTLIKEALEKLGDSEAFKEMNQRILEMQESTVKGGATEKLLSEELAENKDDLALMAKGNKKGEVVVKATVLRASVVGNQQAVELPDIGKLAHAQLTAYDIFRKIPVSTSNHNGTIRYYDWDDDTTVRAANMVAEGAVFPESTAVWQTNVVTLKKVGDTLPVSEEFFEDEEMFAAELNMFLDTNVKIKINDQIINGDGTGQNLTGIFQSVPAYTPVASGIQDANVYDLLVKGAESITSTGGAKYRVDFALMNISDILRMKLKKDDNNNYIIPPFVSRDGKQVDSIVILEENAVPANTMVLGDRRFVRIYEKSGVVLSTGMVNAQFTEDMETLKARARLLFLIRNIDRTGFKKITDITAALTTLALPLP